MNRIPITALIGDRVKHSYKFGAMTIITFISRRYLVLTDIPGLQGAEAFDPDNQRKDSTMPDDNDGSNTETNGGGDYGASNGGPGFGGGGGGPATATAVDAATIGGVLAGVSMTFSGNPALASVGLMTTGGTLLGGNVQQAVTDFTNTQGAIGPGFSGPNMADFANVSAGLDITAAASGGPGVTDYFNSGGQLVGSTFDQAAADQYNNFMASLGGSGG